MNESAASLGTAVPDRTIWLAKAHLALRPLFSRLGLVVPRPVFVTIGALPSGVGGQCTLSPDDPPVITVSHGLRRSMSVLGTLVHEMIHASLPFEENHGPVFRAWAKQIGLTGPPTSTQLGPRLYLRLRPVADRLGPYPSRSNTVMFNADGEAIA